jgi:SAM-dependent methyltransferase
VSAWRRHHVSRTRYCTWSREPFFELAGEHLPADGEACVVDLAAGNGEFARQLALPERYANLWLLDGNPKSVEALRKQFRHVEEYVAPAPLPFPEVSVDFLHCSHLIEHLHAQELRPLLGEVDRVLRVGGVFVVSAPLLHPDFFGDPTHVRPYPPVTLRDFLCQERPNRTVGPVSTSYVERELVFRHAPADLGQGWGATLAAVDLVMHVGKRLLRAIGLRHTFKSGYTIVLEKGS